MPASVTVPAAATSANFQRYHGGHQQQFERDGYRELQQQLCHDDRQPGSVGVGVFAARNPASLGSNPSSTCTVTLTQPAPRGGASVTLSNTNSTLTVPASVTVPQRPVRRPSAPRRRPSAAIQARRYRNLQQQLRQYHCQPGGARVGFLTACSPASLGPNSSSTCTVSLTQPAPSGGASVVLSNTNSTSRCRLRHGRRSGHLGDLHRHDDAISSNSSATITATYNSSSATATVSLVAPVLVSSLSCSPTSLGPTLPALAP